MLKYEYEKNNYLVTFLGVIGLTISYQQARVQARGEALIADAYYGKLDEVKDDLEDGADLNFTFLFSDSEREYTGVTFNVLHAAASSGNEDVINYLLEQHLDINAQTPTGWTPLFIAARDGRTEAAKLLIFREADVNLPTDLGATPLLMAVTQPYPTEEERLNLITYLLDNEADPNLATHQGLTPLYYAAVTHRLDIVKILVENNALLTPKMYQHIINYLNSHPNKDNKKIITLLKKAVSSK